MTRNEDMARRLELLLALTAPPVGVIFGEKPLPDIAKLDKAEPASCAYWKLAAQGRLFYTTSDDHRGCPIGAHTHGVELNKDDATNLMSMAGMMTGMGYLSEREVSQIPRRARKLVIATYGPLARLPQEADVVFVQSSPRAAMLLGEAEHALGARSERAPVVRPACAMIPEVSATRQAMTSFGCIGNRVYTELSDDEVWSCLPGEVLSSVLDQLGTVSAANQNLEAFHRGRLEQP
jgi:uncharacterized protein (DUF169 family)